MGPSASGWSGTMASTAILPMAGFDRNCDVAYLIIWRGGDPELGRVFPDVSTIAS
jgi:hypothetical protein